MKTSSGPIYMHRRYRPHSSFLSLHPLQSLWLLFFFPVAINVNSFFETHHLEIGAVVRWGEWQGRGADGGLLLDSHIGRAILPTDSCLLERAKFSAALARPTQWLLQLESDLDAKSACRKWSEPNQKVSWKKKWVWLLGKGYHEALGPL